MMRYWINFLKSKILNLKILKKDYNIKMVN